MYTLIPCTPLGSSFVYLLCTYTRYTHNGIHAPFHIPCTHTTLTPAALPRPLTLCWGCAFTTVVFPVCNKTANNNK